MMIYELEPKWSVCCKIAETSFVPTDQNSWGKVKVPKTAKPMRKADQFVKHEPSAHKNQAMLAGAQGTSDTTKKIMQNSIATRIKLSQIDDVISK